MPTHNDKYQVRMFYALPDGVEAENVWGYALADPAPDNPSNADILAAISARQTAYLAYLSPWLADVVTVTYTQVDRVEWNVDFWETVEHLGTIAHNVTGSEVTEMLPHGVAAVITAYTSHPRVRCRKFFPGLAEGDCSGSTLLPALQTDLTSMAALWLTGIVVTGAAKLYAQALSVSGAYAGTVSPLVAAAISPIMGYQRRRKPGVGS